VSVEKLRDARPYVRRRLHHRASSPADVLQLLLAIPMCVPFTRRALFLARFISAAPEGEQDSRQGREP